MVHTDWIVKDSGNDTAGSDVLSLPDARSQGKEALISAYGYLHRRHEPVVQYVGSTFWGLVSGKVRIFMLTIKCSDL